MPAKLTIQEFIQKANKAHINFYSYVNSIYLGMNSQISVICPKHGEFFQLASNHISGKGCPICKGEQTSIRCKHSTSKFIRKAKKIHGYLYDYSKVKYKLDSQKVVVICKEHGEFK